MAKAKASKGAITLPRLNLQRVELTLIRDAALICHPWSDKAKRMMLDKQMKPAQPAKQAKDGERDFKESLYPHPEGGYGFPTIAFKAAAVDAASFTERITKVLLRGAFHIDGELVRIKGELTPREDMVRIAMGTADIRYRGEFQA
jgi:hypothetical protein